MLFLKRFSNFTYYFIVISIVSTILIIWAGVKFYNYEEQKIKQSEFSKLKAIANLKINEILVWRNERLSDAIHFSNSPLYSKNVYNCLRQKNLKTEIEIIKRNIMIKQLRGFKAVFIADTLNNEYFSTENEHFIYNDSCVKQYIDSSFRLKKIYFSDIYNSPQKCRQIVICSPIIYEERVIATMVFLIDPEIYLNRQIQSWPIPSNTSEAILLHHFKGKLVPLNNLKFSVGKFKPANFTENYIITDKSYLHNGIFEGVDYRNQEVFSYVSQIKGTPWYLLVKVDRKEILSELVFRAIIVFLFIFITVLILTLIISLNFQLRKRLIQRNLLNTSKRLKDIVEFLPDAILAIDKQGKVIVWNRAMQLLTGIPENEIMGKSDFEYAIPFFGKRHPILIDFVLNDYKDYINNYISFKKEGNTLIAESDMCIVKNRKVYLYGKATPLVDQDGEIYGAIELIRDITESKEQESLLKDREIIFRSLLEHSPVYVFFKDYDIRAKYLSKNYENLLKKPLNEILGKNMFELFPSEFAAKMVIDDKKILEEDRLIEVEEELNGRYFNTIKFPIKLEGKEPMLAGFTLDITERKNAEKALLKALERAEQSEKLKDAFLQNMSHEIRTPMNAIIGFSELLNSKDIDIQKIKNYISIIISSSNQLLSIVDDILTVSRIQTKQEIVNMSRLNINTLIDNIYEIFRLKISDRDIQLIKYTTLTDEEAWIQTDATKLNQIITNLLSNAVKFTTHGEIEFGCKINAEGMLEFKVRDSGIGIIKEKQDIIFDRFTQADITISKKYGGTGLGLSISKAYVELLGGKINVESEPCKGATFTFTINYKKVTPVNETKNFNFKPGENGEKVILVAEDEKFNYQFIEEVLSGSKHKLIWVQSGTETINHCRENKLIDLVLMDIKMPDMDGYQAMKEIRKFNSNLPIIAQTAYAQDSDKEHFLNSGFTDYVSKPINIQELLKKINKYL